MPLAHRDEGDEIGRNVTVLKKYFDQSGNGGGSPALQPSSFPFQFSILLTQCQEENGCGCALAQIAVCFSRGQAEELQPVKPPRTTFTSSLPARSRRLAAIVERSPEAQKT